MAYNLEVIILKAVEAKMKKRKEKNTRLTPVQVRQISEKWAKKGAESKKVLKKERERDR